jgi:predicted dehydrogenase
MVVGCGHLGRIHARLLAELDSAELVAVVDPRPAARQAVAQDCGVQAAEDYDRLLPVVDAAVVAAPTSLHFAIARELIDAGIHLLVEKPLATTHQQCDELVQRARAAGVTLAVGHVERFNPALVAAQSLVQRPRYIEATRCSGFSFRSLDVGVVLDLMIHDLELVLALVDGVVTGISAVGLSVVTPQEDLAEARIQFSNGCIAELKASRTSPLAARQLAIYGDDEHAFVDLGERRVQVVRRSQSLRQGTLRVDRLDPAEMERLKPHIFETLLPMEQLEVVETNPLRDELLDFLTSVERGGSPRVDAVQGARAVWLAEQIVAEIDRQRPEPAHPAARRAA